MNSLKFVSVINKYKKCPCCKASYKTNALKVDLKDEVITITCQCGFFKKVDEDNKEIKEC